MADLGVDVVSLDGEPADVADRLGTAAGEVDVVIDYLWGAASATAVPAIVSARADRDRLLSRIQVGSVAGPSAEIPSAALRAARLQLIGSGQGSVPTRDIVAELPELAAAITTGAPDITAVAVPLARSSRPGSTRTGAGGS